MLPSITNKTAVSLFDQAIVSGTRFVTAVLVGRLGSESELGIYSLAFSILVLFVSCQESLIAIPYTVFAKRESGSDQRKYSGSSLAQSIALNVIAMIVLGIGCAVLMLTTVSGQFITLLLILAVLLPALLLREFARRFAFAHLDVRSALVLDTVVSVFQLTGIGVIALFGEVTAIWAFVATGVASAVGGFVWVCMSRRQFSFDRQRMKPDLRRNWEFGKWVASAHLVSVAHMYFPYWLLAVVYDEKATGIFSACMMMFLLANPFILGMCNILSPKAAHQFVDHGLAEVGKIVWKFAAVIFAALTALSIGAYFYGGQLVELIFGDRYADNDATVTILAVGTIGLGISYAVASGLRAIDRPQVNFWTGLVGLVITLLVGLLLVGPWGIYGASVGLISGFFAMAICRSWVFARLISDTRQ